MSNHPARSRGWATTPRDIARQTLMVMVAVGGLAFAAHHMWQNREDFLRLLPDSWAYVIRRAIAPRNICNTAECPICNRPAVTSEVLPIPFQAEGGSDDPVSASQPENSNDSKTESPPPSDDEGLAAFFSNLAFPPVIERSSRAGDG